MRFESYFIVFAGIRTLFYFKHFCFFDTFKAVTARNKKNNISCFNYLGLKIFLIVGIEVTAEFSFFDDENFFCVKNFAFYFVMNMWKISESMMVLETLLCKNFGFPEGMQLTAPRNAYPLRRIRDRAQQARNTSRFMITTDAPTGVPSR